ncbi:hypothetical protein BJY52DRAFT_1306273 [Lactarius psammicola]|nr:hypothetical protein BJY52DRAFT_1306273 [Lactarius psammicola]
MKPLSLWCFAHLHTAHAFHGLSHSTLSISTGQSASAHGVPLQHLDIQSHEGRSQVACIIPSMKSSARWVWGVNNGICHAGPRISWVRPSHL